MSIWELRLCNTLPYSVNYAQLICRSVHSVQQTSSYLHSSQLLLLLPVSPNLSFPFFSEQHLIVSVSLLAEFLQQLSGYLFVLHPLLSPISQSPPLRVSV